MPRSPRRQQWAEEACSHLLNCGHNREAVFADDADRGRFLARLARSRFRLYHSYLRTDPLPRRVHLPTRAGSRP